MPLLMTRPQRASERFVSEVAAALGRPVRHVIAPCMEIMPHGEARDLAGFAGVVFTSEAGPQSFAALGGVGFGPAYCVGPRTAAAAEAAGFEVALIARDADDLVARCAATGPLIHMHGTHTRGDVAARLTARGIRVESADVYGQIERPLTAQAMALLRTAVPVCLPLFSPRSAALFAEARPERMAAQLHVVTLSPAVAICVTWPHVSLEIAQAPTGDSICEAVANRMRIMDSG